MNTVADFAIEIPLGKKSCELARNFAAEQATPEKGKRVYFNTLAVEAVRIFLEWMEIDTETGDSWNSGSRALFDVGDLVLPGFGTLECRPVFLGEKVIPLPAEVRENRLGCVAVLFEEELKVCKLLGFIPASNLMTSNLSELPEAIEVDSLKPIEEFLEVLDALENEKILAASRRTVREEAADMVSGIAQTVEKLGRWFDNNFGVGWEPVPAAYVRNLRVKEPEFENAISRAKEFDLGATIAGRSIVLVVRIIPTENEEFDVMVRVFPAGNASYIPAGLKLIVEDEYGEKIPPPVEARDADNWLQLGLEGGTPGTAFGVTLTLEDASMTEYFII